MVRKVGWAQTCPPPLPSWADPLLLLSDLLSGPIQLHHAPTGKTGIKSSFFKKLKKNFKNTSTSESTIKNTNTSESTIKIQV